MFLPLHFCILPQHMAEWEQLFLPHCLSVYAADGE